MSNSIPRKPVASAAGAPPVAHPPAPFENISDSDLSMDLEKSAYGERTRRVSTGIDEPLAPARAPTYKRVITGFGDNFIFEKARSFHFRKPGTSKGAFAQGNGIWGRHGQQIGGQKRYFGLSRRSFLICLAALIIVILAIAVGLGVGLSKGNKWVHFPFP